MQPPAETPDARPQPSVGPARFRRLIRWRRTLSVLTAAVILSPAAVALCGDGTSTTTPAGPPGVSPAVSQAKSPSAPPLKSAAGEGPKSASKDAGKDTPAKEPKTKAGKGDPVEEARRQLAVALAMTPVQKADYAEVNRRLDAERTSLMTGMDTVLAGLRKTVMDDAAGPDERQAALRKLDDFHAAFRKIEAERKYLLTTLLSPDQRRKLDELSRPPAEVVWFIRDGLTFQINKALRRLNLTAEQSARVRPLTDRMEQRLSKAEHDRIDAVDDFEADLLAVLTPAQKADWDKHRVDFVRPKGTGKKAAEIKSAVPAAGEVKGK